MSAVRRIAQLCVVAVGAAMFLAWRSADPADASGEALRGTSADEGQLVLLVAIVTAALIQAGWRPAWIGVGFTSAISVRAILDLSGDGAPDPAIGLWLAALLSIAAVALLLWDMFAGVARPDPDADATGDGGSPSGGRGMSGPLGRRKK